MEFVKFYFSSQVGLEPDHLYGTEVGLHSRVCDENGPLTSGCNTCLAPFQVRSHAAQKVGTMCPGISEALRDVKNDCTSTCHI